MKKSFVAIVAALSLAGLATACSDDSSSSHGGMDMGDSSETTAEHSSLPKEVNEADVTFAQSMIPHHRQAIEMAQHELDNGVDPETKALATRIKDAQDPEIAVMTGWLTAWDREVPSGEGHGSMAGMMSEEEMEDFTSADGAEVDRVFLEMMIRHHEGAVEMANEEIDDGRYADAVDMARSIASSQTAEIADMQQMLLDHTAS